MFHYMKEANGDKNVRSDYRQKKTAQNGKIDSPIFGQTRVEIPIGSMCSYLITVSRCTSVFLDPDNDIGSGVLHVFDVGSFQDGQRRASYLFGGDS